MLRPSAPDLRVYLHRAPIDMRAGRNGLAAIAREVMQKDPFDKTCFLFTNKRYTALKILAWDINGFSLWSKVIESREKFAWPRLFQEDVVDLTSEQLHWLMDGYDVWARPHKAVNFTHVSVYSVRDRAIMELFYSSALRPHELVRLNRGDIDFPEGVVRVLGKGNVARIVPVGSFAIKAVQRWLRVRSEIAKEGERAVFVGRGGRRLGPRAVQVRVDYWARRQGIATHVHPHMFRHACATHVLESSGNIREVQELLGHASISTTQIYTHLNAQHLFEVYEKAHPRARRVKGANE